MTLRAWILTTAAGGAVLTAAPAAAQPIAYSHVLRVYNVGATTPIQQTTAPAAAATCGQDGTPIAATPVVNPTAVEYDDPNLPAGSGKVCRIQLAAFFGGLPVGPTMLARLALVDDEANLQSPESDPSNPFVRRAEPPRAVHVRLVRGGGA